VQSIAVADASAVNCCHNQADRGAQGRVTRGAGYPRTGVGESSRLHDERPEAVGPTGNGQVAYTAYAISTTTNT